MKDSSDRSSLWNKLDRGVRNTLLNSVLGTLECTICSDIMHVPFLASCGHSFCYSCLKSWFDTKVNCPTCRKDLEYAPILNIQLKEVSNNISDIIIGLTDDANEAEQMTTYRQDMFNEYEEDFKAKQLFGEAFTSALTLIDTSDGVPRCGNCHWEAHGSVCLHCGSRFRVPRDDSYYDSEDGDAYNEDDEEIVLYGRDNDNEAGEPNEYDSEDSFIDAREMSDIAQDMASENNDDELLSSGNEGIGSGSEWHGFNDHDDTNISDDSVSVTSESGQPFVDGRLRDLLVQEHARDLTIHDISDDEDDQDFVSRRPGGGGVIHISSDEDE